MFEAAAAPEEMSGPIAVVTTVGSSDEAMKIAAMLVESRLAACVQISEIASVYAWEGTVRNDREYRLVVKTVVASYPAVEEAIRRLHSYDLPAIHAISFERVYAPYGDWIAENSQGVR